MVTDMHSGIVGVDFMSTRYLTGRDKTDPEENKKEVEKKGVNWKLKGSYQFCPIMLFGSR